jgi:hypothetical protein
MVGLETPYPGAIVEFVYTLPLFMVGFETLYPGAIVGLNHPAPDYSWI